MFELTTAQLISIGLAAVSAVGILLIVLALTRETSGDRVQARLDRFGNRQVPTLEDLELQRPFLERLLRPIGSRFARAAGRLSTASYSATAARRLATAGNPGDLSVPEWLALKVMITAGAAVGGFALLLVVHASVFTTISVGLLITAVGWIGPESWLGSRVRTRQKRILRSLPDSLDLLTISVRAGLGFDAALQRVVEKVPGPLSAEFKRALAEIRVGKTRREAMRAIVPRTDVKALGNFIGAILQADQLGVPIARVLQIQSEQLRIERRQEAETMAAKAPIKMLFPLVGCILPALFVVILGPALILISTSLPE